MGAPLLFVIALLLLATGEAFKHPMTTRPQVVGLKRSQLEKGWTMPVARSEKRLTMSAVDFQYVFMLPVAAAVATCAITAGIGGAALFAPIFLLVFPLLGPEYAISSPAAAVATAILTESFGFGSGLVGYYRRGLIDLRLALPFLCVSVPASAFAASTVAQHLDPILLKLVYTLLMLAVSAYLLSGGTGNEVAAGADVEGRAAGDDVFTKTDSAGTAYTYPASAREFSSFSVTNALLTSFGGLLTGSLGVGIGEIALPSLLKRGVPVAVAAATSTLVVALSAWTAAFFQLRELAAEAEDGGLGSVVPVGLVIWLIPGVVVGAQVASRLQGRVQQEQLERVIGVLFGAIGLCFGCIVAQSLLVG